MLNDYIEPDQVNMKSAQLKKHFKAKLIKYLIGEINEIKNPIKLLPE